MEMRFWIRIRWKEAGESRSFRNRRSLYPWGQADHSFGYTWTCGLFSRNGETLQVLDYGILVISGADGVQGHTRTLWRLLSRYQIPVFLFINKMDQPVTDRKTLLVELKEKLDTNCVDFSEDR